MVCTHLWVDDDEGGRGEDLSQSIYVRVCIRDVNHQLLASKKPTEH